MSFKNIYFGFSSQANFLASLHTHCHFNFTTPGRLIYPPPASLLPTAFSIFNDRRALVYLVAPLKIKGTPTIGLATYVVRGILTERVYTLLDTWTQENCQ